MRIAITPPTFHPRVELHADGRVEAARDALSAPGDMFASGLEFTAIAIDDLGRPLFAAARAPAAWQRRLVDRIVRAVTKLRGSRRLRAESAAATVLLDLFEGARGRDRASRSLRRDALSAYLDLFETTRSTRLVESMTANLDRVRNLLDGEGRDALRRGWGRIRPETPPYAAWFPDGSGDVRVLCQVQDVFYDPWRAFFTRDLRFKAESVRDGRIKYVREDVIGRRRTRFVVDYVRKAEGIFTAMSDARTDVVIFLGHSDWWARVPRNLAAAPDQVGEKLLVLILCFGKHFYHTLHEKYPRAHIVTTKDPTEDPEDVALLGHLFDGLAARRGWRSIRRASVSDHRTDHNFIFPGDARYVAGVIDDDRDGRLDRFDRFCNVGAPRTLSPVGNEESFVVDPPGLHPRGAELSPRELDGGKVFEAALMLNSLSYDNFWLDQVNAEQKVVAGGWHNVPPGEFAATRLVRARRDGSEIYRLTCSTRYARASQPALTAMVAWEGWRWLASLLPRSRRPAPLDEALMGIMLVAHALANAAYDEPDQLFRAFLRRWGFPAYIRFHEATHAIEADPRWESGAPKAVRAFLNRLHPGALARLRRMVHARHP